MTITQNGPMRSVHVEVEVAATPAETWSAIATGEGISAWFMPAHVDGRVGGRVTVEFGPGMESHATITTWDPPHRFVAWSDDLGHDAPSLVTEWKLAARGAGHTLVRVEHHIATTRTDWDAVLESSVTGWPSFLRMLRLYVAHFNGLPSATFAASVEAQGSDAWDRLLGALGLAGVEVGERRHAPDDAPSLGGLVEHIGDGPDALIVRLDAPAPGLAVLGRFATGATTRIVMRTFLYGDQAQQVAAREAPLWQVFLAKRLGVP